MLTHGDFSLLGGVDAALEAVEGDVAVIVGLGDIEALDLSQSTSLNCENKRS